MRFRQSIRDALRSIHRQPAHAALVVATLAIGIGATTAMFSVVDTLLIRPLPYANAERLIELGTAPEGTTRQSPGLSFDAIQGIRNERIFQALEAYQFGAATLTGDGDASLVSAPAVSPGLFPLLGVTPHLGRLFTDDDAAAGHVALISERLWRGRFGSESSVVGRRMTIDGDEHTIIGVLPAGFKFPEERATVWRPLSLTPGRAMQARVQAIAAMAPGVSRAATDQQLLALSAPLRESGMLASGRVLAAQELLQRRFARQYQTALSVMFGAVALVLLVACTNVASLLLARASSRAGEFALMGALGSGRLGVAGQMLAESLLLGLIGGIAGTLGARWLLAAMLGIVPQQMLFLAGMSAALDGRVLAFALGLSLATCGLVSILPAWSAGRLDLVTTLKRQSSGSLGGRHDRWQATLVGGQLTIVMVMLAGAGLLTRSFIRLVSVNPGFETAGLVVFTFQFSDPRYTQAGISLEFIRRLDELVESSSLGASSTYSVGTPPRAGGFRLSNEAEAEGRQVINLPDLRLPTETAAPDYFQTLGIPLVAGRTFVAADADSIVINDVLARRYWGDESPVGRRFRLGRDQPWRTVIGVVGDVKQMGLSDPMGEGMEVYFPFSRDSRGGFLSLTLRTTADTARAVALVKDLVRRLDATLPLTAETMDQRFAESVWQPRFFLRLVVAFAAVALLLAGVGVYATAAYWVIGRRRELAVRMALGATRARVINLILRRGLTVAGLGAICGLAAAAAGGRLIESMLFATSTQDPGALLMATLLLTLLVLAGCFVPVLRAARTDPMTVLRAE